MQVLDLGITRMLVHRLLRFFAHVCKDHIPASGTTKGACRVANIRFEEMGRLSKASSGSRVRFALFFFLGVLGYGLE